MTIMQSRIQSLGFETEAAGAFGTDLSATGTYKPVPAREGTVQLAINRPTASPLTLQQHIDGYPTEVLLPKSGTLSFDVNLDTFDARAGDGVAAQQGALGEMLAVAFGTERLGTGDTINDATPGTETNTVTTAGRWEAGAAAGMPTGDNGELECREIEGMSGSDQTLKLALSNAPSNGGTIYNAATYYLSELDSTETTSGQFRLQGRHIDDRWLLMGCALESMTLNLTAGQIPYISMTWKFADWKHSDEAALGFGAVLADVTYANKQELVVADSELRVQTVGTATLANTEVLASEITFEPSIQYTAITTPGGANNVHMYLRTRQTGTPVITGSFTLPFQGEAVWHDVRNAQTRKAVFFQIGNSTANGAALIAAPNVQITDHQMVDVEGISGETVSWKGSIDTDTGGASTDLARAAFRIHLF